MSGYIDIVCNLYDPIAVRKGQTGIDATFKRQVRMDKRLWGGVPVSQYLRKMDRAGIERSLLIAVRAGDLRVRGSFELPYERVAKVCEKYPDRFSGLAGVDPFRGMQGLRDLEHAVRSLGFVGAHLYPHWFELAPDHAKYYPYYAKCAELDIPIMMQIGHNLVYSQSRRLPSVGRPIALDRVAIDFNPGITAIVGPNGCGKSNISDAIRWVLGEQRPTLVRGSRMDEVIFAGSRDRKPINLAEVVRETEAPVDIHAVQIEQFGESAHRLEPDVISARALAPLPRLFELAQPLFGPETRGLFLKGREAEAEVEEAMAAWDFAATLHQSLTSADSHVVEVRALRPRAQAVTP